MNKLATRRTASKAAKKGKATPHRPGKRAPAQPVTHVTMEAYRRVVSQLRAYREAYANLYEAQKELLQLFREYAPPPPADYTPERLFKDLREIRLSTAVAATAQKSTLFARASEAITQLANEVQSGTITRRKSDRGRHWVTKHTKTALAELIVFCLRAGTPRLKHGADKAVARSLVRLADAKRETIAFEARTHVEDVAPLILERVREEQLHLAELTDLDTAVLKTAFDQHAKKPLPKGKKLAQNLAIQLFVPWFASSGASKKKATDDAELMFRKLLKMKDKRKKGD